MSTHEDPLGAALDALGFHVEATREKVALARREDGARLAVTRREGVVEVHCLDVLEGWLEADLSEAEVAFEELLGAVDAREAPDGEQRALMDGLAWLTEREGFTLALTRRRPMEVSLR